MKYGFDIDLETAIEALSYCVPDDRDEWVEMGMALKSEFGEAAYEAWSSWSMGYDKYKESTARATWRSFKRSGLSIGTLLGKAKERGWKFSPVELSATEEQARKREVSRRRAQLLVEQEIEDAKLDAWRLKLSDFLTELLDRFEGEGFSQYLMDKKVPAFGLLFPKEPMIVIADDEKDQCELILGNDLIQDFWKIPKDERPSFRFIKRGVVGVPMVDEYGRLWNIQLIYKDGGKCFFSGKKQGLFHIIGEVPESGRFNICESEGYSNAACVHMALGLPAVVAFDSGNLIPVIKAVDRMHFDRISKWAVCGDNDSHLEKEGKKNVGKIKALAASVQVNGFPVFPELGEKLDGWLEDNKGSPDFNDEFQLFGLEEFANRIKQRLSVAEPLDGGDAEGNDNDLPSEVDGWTAGDPPDDEQPPLSESCAGGDGWQRDFLTGRDGPKGCAYNANLIFLNDPRWRGVFAENIFTGAIDVMRQPPIDTIDPGELTDQGVAMLHCWIEENYDIVMQDGGMRKALITVAAKNRYHPVQDYLKSLEPWDGEVRGALWLKRALGAKNEPNLYLSKVGEKFLIGAVRRIMNAPDVTKVDNMLVFEGLQGDGKSSLVKALFEPWHGDTPLPLGDKDAYINIRGCWGYEMAEMDSFNKAAVSTAKTFLSSSEDNYRPPFGTKNQKYPRQTVMIGTVNHIEYLIDSSGNRRYWPLWAYDIDIEWLHENRAQLWAEALHQYNTGVPHWIDKKTEPELSELVLIEQAYREHPDAWEAKIAIWMWSGKCKSSSYNVPEILEQAIDIDVRAVTKQHEMKLSNALQKLGWIKKRPRVEDKGKPIRVTVYHPPEGTMQIVGGNTQDKTKDRSISNEVGEAQF